MTLPDGSERAETLLDRIHARLAESGPLHSEDLATEFLRLTSGVGGGRLIDRMLTGQRDFARTPDARWAARPKPPRELTETSFVCVAVDVAPGGAIHRGAALAMRGSDTEMRWRAETPSDVDPRALLDALRGGVIVAEHAPSLWRWVRANTDAEIADYPALSLGRLATGLFPDAGISALDDLAERLGIATPRSDELAMRAARVADILTAAIETAALAGARSLHDLIALQYTGANAVDFSRFAFDESAIRALPDTPGVYVMRDHEGECLYVGKARALRTRVRSYFYPVTARDAKLERLLGALYDLETHDADSELAALLLEHEMIERLRPEVNTQRDVHGGDVAVVPAVIVESASEAGSVSLIGVTRVRLHRCVVAVEALDAVEIEAWLGDVLADLDSGADRTESRHSQPTAEGIAPAPDDVVIAARYLARHRDALTWLDLRQVPEPGLGADRLATLIASRLAGPAPVRAV